MNLPSDTPMRVRFAPSPTGHLHIGGARTALYNWLLARGSGGSFVLRIEDTDEDRSTEENIHEIERALRWLGLDWDEGPGVGGAHGPYRQTERADIYREHLEILRSKNAIYECYCTSEELETSRTEALAAGNAPVYDRRCRDLSPQECAQRVEEGRAPALRFRVPDSGSTFVKDAVRGNVEFRNDLTGDFIIVRQDGMPTFNFANVIDDMTMQITHVVRGEDHLSNTPRQILIYQALGATPPIFGHLPMIVGADRKPLSKRHGSSSVDEFAAQGYLPEALVNYLALIGWSLDGSTTLFTTDELITKFSLDRVGKTAGVFDMEKLTWMNGVYLREASIDRLTEVALPLISGAGLIPADASEADVHRVRAAVTAARPKLKLLTDLLHLVDYLLLPEVVWEDSAIEKLKADEDLGRILREGTAVVAGIEDFRYEPLETALRELCTTLEVKAGRLFGALRISISGKTVTAGLFESLEALGKEESLRRLQAAAERLGVA